MPTFVLNMLSCSMCTKKGVPTTGASCVDKGHYERIPGEDAIQILSAHCSVTLLLKFNVHSSSEGRYVGHENALFSHIPPATHASNASRWIIDSLRIQTCQLDADGKTGLCLQPVNVTSYQAMRENLIDKYPNNSDWDVRIAVESTTLPPAPVVSSTQFT